MIKPVHVDFLYIFPVYRNNNNIMATYNILYFIIQFINYYYKSHPKNPSYNQNWNWKLMTSPTKNLFLYYKIKNQWLILRKYILDEWMEIFYKNNYNEYIKIDKPYIILILIILPLVRDFLIYLL